MVDRRSKSAHNTVVLKLPFFGSPVHQSRSNIHTIQGLPPTHSTHPQPTTNIHKHPSHRLDNNGQNPSHLDNIGIHTTTRYSPSICVSISLNLTRMFEARFPNPAVFQCEHDVLSNKLLKPGSLIPRCFSANIMSSPTNRTSHNAGMKVRS